MHFGHAKFAGIFFETDRHDGTVEGDFQKGTRLVCLEGGVASAMRAGRPSVILEDGQCRGIDNSSRRIAE